MGRLRGARNATAPRTAARHGAGSRRATSRRCSQAGAPRHQVFAAFVASLTRRTTPTVVVLEDVHWADAATLDLLALPQQAHASIRALIVVTWRADEVGRRSRAVPRARRTAGRLDASHRAATAVARRRRSDGRDQARRASRVRADGWESVLRHRSVAQRRRGGAGQRARSDSRAASLAARRGPAGPGFRVSRAGSRGNRAGAGGSHVGHRGRHAGRGGGTADIRRSRARFPARAGAAGGARVAAVAARAGVASPRAVGAVGGGRSTGRAGAAGPPRGGRRRRVRRPALRTGGGAAGRQPRGAP